MRDTCLLQNYVNCIGKVKVCGCRRFRESVLYGQCLFCSSPCLPLSYFLLVRLSCSFPPEVLSRISLSAFCILLSFPPLQFSPVSSVCLPLSFLFFIIFLFTFYNLQILQKQWLAIMKISFKEVIMKQRILILLIVFAMLFTAGCKK